MSGRPANARAERVPHADPRKARLRDFICWRTTAASPPTTFVAPAEDVMPKPDPSPAPGPPAPDGEREERKRKGQFYTSRDLATRYVRQLQDHIDLDEFQIVEPSAGDGAFMTVLPFGTFDATSSHTATPSSGPTSSRWRSTATGTSRALATRPFGRNSKLAIRFFNRAASFSEVIAFILPKTFRKTSVINSLDDRFHLLCEELVPDDAFIFEGKSRSVPTVFQIWVRRDHSRARLLESTTHPDFEFLPAADSLTADFAMQRVGKNAGRVHHDLWRSHDAHYFIKGDVELIMEELRPAFIEAASNTAGKPSLSKSEIVAIYNERLVRVGGSADGP